MLLSPVPQTFGAYAVTGLILCFNLLYLWMYSAVTRGKEKISPNPEDTKVTGAQISDQIPPQTARVLRAHANAQAAILPFLLLGLIYTLAGGGATTATITFGIFCIARWLHTFCYLGAKQPLRTISFLTGVAAYVALMVEIIVILIQN